MNRRSLAISPSTSPSRRSPRPPKAVEGPPWLVGLNDAQREAVTHLDGPLVIIAGAGTGKTRVLAHRIAALLDRIPGLTPDRILALTFSRRAAEEMRERVEQLLGASADTLPVSTFHAFCHQVLQDHGVEIGLPRRLRLLDRVEQWMFFKSLLPDLPLAHYATRADPAGSIDGFLRFISRAKDELVSPEEYAAYVERLPRDVGRGVADPADRRRQAEVAGVYAHYQTALRAAGALDFGDLVVETLRLFRERPAILAHYQQQYPYLLVDEFQDTNVAQVTLLTAVAGPSRNLCVVGDDDQAIYRFRGASYASFLLFQERFPDAATVRLAQNYRSTPPILRTAGRLIRGNGEDRYDPQKTLWTAATGSQAVELVVCRDYLQEARLAADRIRALMAAWPPSERAWGRIAVLYRAHAHREMVEAALRQEGIPVVVAGGTALFDEPIVRDLLAWLRIIHDPEDSIAFFRAGSVPALGLPLPELVTASRAAKQQRRSLYDALRLPKAVTLPAATRARVKRLLDRLHTWQRVAAREGVDEVTRQLVEEIGYRPRLYAAVSRLGRDPAIPDGSFGGAGDAQARRDLTMFSRWSRFVRRYLETHGRARDLGAFLDYVEAYQQAGGEFGEEAAPEEGDGVRLMTIHQAKGLEFDWVFLVSLVQGRFPSRTRPEVIPFPVELMKERLPSGDFHLQEERRLCYVAMTRAREGLVLTTVERPYHRPSVFLRELAGDAAAQEDLARIELSPAGQRAVPAFSSAPGASQEGRVAPLPLAAATGSVAASEQAVVEILQALTRLAPSDQPAIEAHLAQLTEAARAMVTSRQLPAPPILAPSPLRLSFTQLESYRFCPRKYQYAYVYQIPTRPTPQMQFGNNLHACLEAFALELMAGKTPSQETLLRLYEETWQSEGYADPRAEAKDKVYGRELLTRYYEVNRETLQPPLFVEKPFLLTVGGATVKGFIDRIDAQPDGRVEILDYKSGKPKTAVEVGDRLQLNIYALACRDVLRMTPAAMSFYYLQTNQKLSFPYDAQGVRETEQTITATAEKIQGGAFEPTPEYGKCRVCDFRTICPSSAV